MPQPSALLKSLAAARQRLLVELEDVRLSLAEVIAADISEGVRQVDIVKETGYTREQVRRIVRSASADQGTDAGHSPS